MLIIKRTSDTRNTIINDMIIKDVDDRLIHYDGKISSDSWMPLPTKTKEIQVSSSGWDGLVSRYNKSKLQLIEVA